MDTRETLISSFCGYFFACARAESVGRVQCLNAYIKVAICFDCEREDENESIDIEFWHGIPYGCSHI